MAASRVRELRAALNTIIEQGRAAVAVYEGRDPTAEESAAVVELAEQRTAVAEDLRAAEELDEAARGFTVTVPDGGDVAISGGEPRIAQDPNRGFKNYGDFVLAVHAASSPAAGPVDERLGWNLPQGAAPTKFSSTIVDAEGGFAVPPGFVEEIVNLDVGNPLYIPWTSNIEVENTNNMRIPTDETPAWNSGATGVRAYWVAEKAQITQSNLNLSAVDLRLQKVAVLVPVTEELLSDARAAGGHVITKSAQARTWMINDALINGDGSGKPTGVMNQASKVTVAKESGQGAATIQTENVVKMFARCLAPTFSRWHINPDAMSQVLTLQIGNYPAFIPPGGLPDAPAGMLLGRPIVWDDSCQTLGTEGDIQLIAWPGMYSLTKVGGAMAATSIHLWFDYDTNAFRLTDRVDSKGMLAAAVDPPNSSATRSHFVTLATRA